MHNGCYEAHFQSWYDGSRAVWEWTLNFKDDLGTVIDQVQGSEFTKAKGITDAQLVIQTNTVMSQYFTHVERQQVVNLMGYFLDPVNLGHNTAWTLTPDKFQKPPTDTFLMWGVALTKFYPLTHQTRIMGAAAQVISIPPHGGHVVITADDLGDPTTTSNGPDLLDLIPF